MSRESGVYVVYRIHYWKSTQPTNRPLSIQMFPPRLTHATSLIFYRAHETLSQSNSTFRDIRERSMVRTRSMDVFVPMWMQAQDGDVEGLTHALDEEGRDPAAGAERSSVCCLNRLICGFLI